MIKRYMAALLVAGMILSGCGSETAATESSTATEEVTEAATEAASEAGTEAGGTDQVATAAEMTTVEEVVEEGMTPVYADAIKDGTYDVEMKSSSSMFKVDHCELVVEDGSMQAILYMTSHSYQYLYAGTAEEAAAADEADYILREDAGDDMGSYTLPIEALDEGIPCAAYSSKKEKWYARTLLFRADSLPADAFLEARGTSPADLNLEDGNYTIEVTLAGGSGRASIESPAPLLVDRIHDGGTYNVTLTWSSPNYDYMIVDGIQYDPVNTEGNSTFVIPLPTLDAPVAIQADTTAMSQPYLIDYTLTFDSTSITAAK